MRSLLNTAVASCDGLKKSIILNSYVEALAPPDLGMQPLFGNRVIADAISNDEVTLE